MWGRSLAELYQLQGLNDLAEPLLKRIRDAKEQRN